MFWVTSEDSFNSAFLKLYAVILDHGIGHYTPITLDAKFLEKLPFLPLQKACYGGILNHPLPVLTTELMLHFQ